MGGLSEIQALLELKVMFVCGSKAVTWVWVNHVQGVAYLSQHLK